MKTSLDCVPCFLRQALEAAQFVTDDSGICEQVIRHILRMVAKMELARTPPLVAQEIHRKLREITGVEDPYRAAKDHSNRLVMNMLPDLTAKVKQASDPFLAAARLATAGNMIDLGVPGNTVVEADIQEAFERVLAEPFVADWGEFQQAVAEAKDILYLADNAGEIVVDQLLVQELGPERVTVAVRGGPVINDATLIDVEQTKLHELVAVIDNGSDASGTILEDCSEEFRRRFFEADLIIAKGQGNFETLSDVGGNTFFLFKVKCPVVAGHTGLEIGTHALIRTKGTLRPTLAPH